MRSDETLDGILEKDSVIQTDDKEGGYGRDKEP